jgi:hypothetical protein
MKFSWRHTSLLLLAALSLNCFKEPLSPVLPTWDATATFPLGSRTYTLADLIAKDTTLLKIGTGSQITFSKSVQVAPTYVNDLLSLSPKDTSVQLQLGAFSVTSPDQRKPINISWLPQGQTVPVPDTTMNFADIQARINVFENITLKSGTISLTVENNLPVAMEVQSPIRLLDPQGNVVATFVFNPSTIPARGSRTANDDLATKTVDSDYRITGLQFHTPGSATPVAIPTGDLLVATLSTSNLKATQATLANIPAQRLADNDTARLRIDDSTLVKELYLKNGSLNFSFRNNVAVPMTFKFRFSDLARRSGSSYLPYEDSLYLAANGAGSMLLNLANTRIKSVDGSLIRALGVLSTVAILPTSGQPVTISQTDKVIISVTRNSTIVIDSAVGVVRPTWVNVDTKLRLNLGKGVQKFSGQLNLPAAQLGLTTTSSVGFPADAYVKIGARKVTGDSVFLQIPVSQRRLTPGQDVIQFDGAEVGRFLSQLASKLPDSLRMYGKILINPSDVYTPSAAGVASVGSNSSVAASANISIPLNLGIVGGIVRDTLVIGDTLANGKKGFTIDKTYIDHYNFGKVYIELENGLPAEIAFNTALLNKSGGNLLTMPQSGQMIRLNSARVDANGNVVAPSKNTTVIELNQQEISQYNPSELVAFSVALNTSSGSPTVQFKTDNQVKIRVWTSLSGRVSK